MDVRFISKANLSRDKINEYFKDTDSSGKMLTIFDNFKKHLQEEAKELNLRPEEFGDSSTFLRKLEQPDFMNRQLDGNQNGDANDFELKEYWEQYGNLFGEDVTLDEFKQFLEFVNEDGKENLRKEFKEVSEKTGLPQEVILNVGLDRAEDLRKIEENGRVFYEYGDPEFDITRYDEHGVQIKNICKGCLDSEGNEITQTYEKDTDGKYVKTEFDEKHNKTTMYKGNEKYTMQNGVVKKETLIDTVEPGVQTARLDEIKLDVNKPDTTSIKFEYDENNKIKNINITQEHKDSLNMPGAKANGFTFDGKNYVVPTPVPKPVASDKTIENIQSMIDGGGIIGKDFDFEMKDGELKIIPKVINNTGEETPEMKDAAFERYKDLISSGIHVGDDFTVEYKDGNFEFRFLNNQARKFECDYLEETYNTDGELEHTIKIKDGFVTQENITDSKKETKRMSEDSFYVELFMNKQYDDYLKYTGGRLYIDGGYNIYKVADQYKAITGNELIGDVYDYNKDHQLICTLCQDMPVKGWDEYPDYGYNMTKEDYIDMYKANREGLKADFNPAQSENAHLLPKIKRQQISPNEFNETHNGNQFNVKLNNGNISITKNGKTVQLDTSNLPEQFVRNQLSKLNAQVLYDAAVGKVKICENEFMNGDYGATVGEYRYQTNTVHIDPNIVTGQRFLNSISHEIGHSLDFVDDEENANKVLKQMMKDPSMNIGRDKPVTMDELKEEYGTNQPMSATNEELDKVFEEELKKYKKENPKLGSQLSYALTNKAELFAESYALLVNGRAKSEYVLLTYFPETLEFIQGMIEENRNIDEQNL